LDLSGLIRTPPEKAEGEEAEPAAEPSAPPPPEAAAPDLEEEEEDDQEETAAERAAQVRQAAGRGAPGWMVAAWDAAAVYLWRCVSAEEGHL
jgi:hypothetical protein